MCPLTPIGGLISLSPSVASHALFFGHGMNRRTIVNSLQSLLIALAIVATVLSMFLAGTCLPEPDRNPASPEFGWLQWQWAVACVVATALLAIAILGSRGWVRRMLVVLALANGVVGVEPALQIFHYRLGR